jgi:hypothetical protein
MSITLLYMIFVRHPAWWITASTVALMAYAVWYVARCPSYPPEPPASTVAAS